MIGKKSGCATVPTSSYDSRRIPQTIHEVTLANSEDKEKYGCRKVTKQIIYLWQENDCHEKLHLRMFVIKRKTIVVAYEATV